jgi:hypothetical protein
LQNGWCLLRMLFYDYAESTDRDLRVRVEATRHGSSGQLTVFKRYVHAIEVNTLREVVLRYVRNHTPRRVADKRRGQQRLASRQRQAAESRCERPGCLEEREVEHLRRQLIQFLSYTFSGHRSSAIALECCLGRNSDRSTNAMRVCCYNFLDGGACPATRRQGGPCVHVMT